MRNLEKDEIEMAARRETMLKEGFRLFAEKGIEAVTMQEVAKACDLGIATLYRYFNTKLVFVIAVGAKMWTEFFTEIEAEYARRGGEMMNAAEELDFYLSMYILLYREHRDLLRFNQNFNGYIVHEQAAEEQLRDYILSVELFARKFHRLYEKGLRDGSIRTDEPEQTMFNTTMHIMLAAVTRYAVGLVYVMEDAPEPESELLLLKEMLMDKFTVK